MPAMLASFSRIPLPHFLFDRLWLQFPIRLLAAIVKVQRLSRERQQLAELDAVQLSDIGLTKADRTAELRKPFWRR